MSDILVSHVSFGERGIEIGYTEDRDRTEKAILFRTIVIDTDIAAEEIAELNELLQDIVDKGLTAILDPPQTIPARQRPEYK